ncbi:hypothetical protein HY988_06915 [Candidatus Micrarchaeota archaeon]|nr:hypothetical protein [Candidatus Micrarchaeota archaeon]
MGTTTKTFIIMLLLFAIAYSAPSCIQNLPKTFVGDQGVTIGIAFSLIIVLIAVAYVIGSVSNNSHYTVFAKDEIYHLGFSALLLVGFGGLIVLSCNVSDFFFQSTFENLGTLSSNCYAPGTGLNTVSACYVKTVKFKAEAISKNYIKNYVDYLMDSSFAVTLQLPLVNSYTAVVGSYKRIISTQYDLVGNTFLIPAFMSLSLQKLALDFINVNVLKWLLPAAFLLRVLSPTRQMGNMLIALSLGLYILVPLMYVFNLAMYDVVDNECPKYSVAVCDNVVDGYSCGPQGGGCGNPNGFWAVAKLIPQAFFLPNLTIAILITFMSAVNKALKVVG